MPHLSKQKKIDPIKIKGTEIMAPTGDWASLMSAFQGGADSVYFGIEQLNLRARASNNFTMDDLPEIASLAKENCVNTYLTLNTVLYDHDIPLMKKIIDAVQETGINAIIAADQAAISYAFRKGVEVLISTQANVKAGWKMCAHWRKEKRLGISG